MSAKPMSGFVFVAENNNNKIPNDSSDTSKNSFSGNPSSSNGPWWKEGAVVFSEISTWIVVPIILALVVGKKLDSVYGTEPWIFIGLAVLGFLITAYGIIKSVQKYAQKQKIKQKK